MCIEECSGEGELGVGPAERTVSVDPLNLNQVILAEGKRDERDYV
jgi:hypothetical protein